MVTSRDRIVTSAITEFARHGYSGARVDRIANLAAVNKRMIYHYFGSKQGLWEEVADCPELAEADFETRSRVSLYRSLEVSAKNGAASVVKDLKRRLSRIQQLQETGVVRTDIPARVIAFLEYSTIHARDIFALAAETLEIGSDADLEAAIRAMALSVREPKPRIKMVPGVRLAESMLTS